MDLSGCGRVTGKPEVMQTAEAAVFARMPSGRDSPKTPALAISPLRPKRAACDVSHTQTANLPCFLAS